MSNIDFDVPEPYRRNPWVLPHLLREVAMLDEAPDLAVLVPEVLEGYKGHEEPAGPCECGGEFWWRAQTGGHKCPGCLTFSDRDGRPVGRTQVTERVA